MVAATFLQLIQCIGTENDASFLASLYKCFTDCLRILGGPAVLSADFHRGVVEATKRQLQLLAERRKERAQRPVADLEDEREDLALLEEMEDFALEDMAKTLQFFDPAHSLLIAVSSVKDLGFNYWNSEDDDEDGEEG
jgi:importin-5